MFKHVKRIVMAMFLAAIMIQPAQAEVVMKLAHGNVADPSDPYQVLALKFKELVEASGVDVKVEIFPGGQIGAEQNAFQDVQTNIIQATVLASNNVSSFATSYSALDLPFLFTSNEEFAKVLKENEADLVRVMIAESDVRPVAWGVQGFRVLSNSKKPVKTINDIKGLKIRLPNNAIQLATFRAWGSDGVPLAFGELFSALQQGVVDGLEMTYISLASLKFYEVQKYVTDLRYKLAINPLVVSEMWFEKQSPKVQEAIIKAGREATAYAIAEAAKMDEAGKKILLANGMVLDGRPSDEQVWIDKSRAIWPDYYKLIKDEKLFNGILKTLNIKKP
ncbi:TRAP transporter substrate-binding protein [Desulfovibrio litoralis]|uniref:Tripartite ATP-independent transporter solute receptor, DctP family n=1 Tax=Desulfovibrio litoralis DSM 11393 TaxID=1121455 RepID=A0A1M7TBM1_9BACT|nr:TRAP transporter substrate-binding protein [Desulfovibrio litoralis]SHN68144.1 tripartite ATP-independent transporter solute receptor, DctP family [Desulfovibrio litoralis DSM 11393]